MVTHIVGSPNDSRQMLATILGALALGVIALLVGALLGHWEIGLVLGAAACLGRLARLVHWRRRP